MVRMTAVYRRRYSASTIRYKITGGNFGDVFDVKETTGAIFVSGPLDYETRKKPRMDSDGPDLLALGRVAIPVLVGKPLVLKGTQVRAERSV
uniref:Cadherin domain-containing protein n=1 Tax=Timema tahoe TaxID=61484 RepID=A0A7R9IEN2_9NEOP|nr:unnamed protein product [Timema tahoe]